MCAKKIFTPQQKKEPQKTSLEIAIDRLSKTCENQKMLKETIKALQEDPEIQKKDADNIVICGENYYRKSEDRCRLMLKIDTFLKKYNTYGVLEDTEGKENLMRAKKFLEEMTPSFDYTKENSLALERNVNILLYEYALNSNIQYIAQWEKSADIDLVKKSNALLNDKDYLKGNYDELEDAVEVERHAERRYKYTTHAKNLIELLESAKKILKYMKQPEMQKIFNQIKDELIEIKPHTPKDIEKIDRLCRRMNIYIGNSPKRRHSFS